MTYSEDLIGNKSKKYKTFSYMYISLQYRFVGKIWIIAVWTQKQPIYMLIYDEAYTLTL